MQDVLWGKSRDFADSAAYTLSMSLLAPVVVPREMFLAHSYPYTFSDLQTHLNVRSSCRRSLYVVFEVLGA